MKTIDIYKRGAGSGWYQAIVDDEDFERASQYTWYARVRRGKLHNVYRIDKGPPCMRCISMHHEITRVPSSQHMDHKNRNAGDNRKCNLRVCSPAENQCNHGPRADGCVKYKGVSYRKHARKYSARIKLEGEELWLGYHDTAELAAIAYDEEAIKVHGDYAWLNRDHFPGLSDGGRGRDRYG